MVCGGVWCGVVWCGVVCCVLCVHLARVVCGLCVPVVLCVVLVVCVRVLWWRVCVVCGEAWHVLSLAVFLSYSLCFSPLSLFPSPSLSLSVSLSCFFFSLLFLFPLLLLLFLLLFLLLLLLFLFLILFFLLFSPPNTVSRTDQPTNFEAFECDLAHGSCTALASHFTA